MNHQSELRILVIDDNIEIHKDFIKILTKSISDKPELDDFEKKIFGENISQQFELPHFVINTASQGEEGIACVEKSMQENYRYALAFVDIRMPPGLDGIETIKRIWAIDPDIQIVICTAFSDYSWKKQLMNLVKKKIYLF